MMKKINCFGDGCMSPFIDLFVSCPVDLPFLFFVGMGYNMC